jgi:hypothetical protein
MDQPDLDPLTQQISDDFGTAPSFTAFPTNLQVDVASQTKQDAEGIAPQMTFS